MRAIVNDVHNFHFHSPLAQLQLPSSSSIIRNKDSRWVTNSGADQTLICHYPYLGVPVWTGFEPRSRKVSGWEIVRQLFQHAWSPSFQPIFESRSSYTLAASASNLYYSKRIVLMIGFWTIHRWIAPMISHFASYYIAIAISHFIIHVGM